MYSIGQHFIVTYLVSAQILLSSQGSFSSFFLSISSSVANFGAQHRACISAVHRVWWCLSAPFTIGEIEKEQMSLGPRSDFFFEWEIGCVEWVRLKTGKTMCQMAKAWALAAMVEWSVKMTSYSFPRFSLQTYSSLTDENENNSQILNHSF